MDVSDQPVDGNGAGTAGSSPGPCRDDEATAALGRTLADARASGTAFEGWQRLARVLGAHKSRTTEGVCEVAAWTPELLDLSVPAHDVFLEVLEPEDGLDLATSRSDARFRRTLVPTERSEDVTYVAARGLTPGTRERIGTFYALLWRDGEGTEHRILDPLAASLPFGAFAPAEFYDVETMLAARKDGDWWRELASESEGTPTVAPPIDILQLHVPTATAGGTLAALTRHVEAIAGRVRAGTEPTAADRLFLGYDSVQLLPVEPTTVYEAGPAFWQETARGAGTVEVALRRPDTTNWGYDVVIAGSAAVNPVLLETGRPDELVDLIDALHAFPGTPKKLVLDVVFGHSDNQGLDCLNPHFFAGANMYGQNLAYRNPAVRAILLEMQRRKVDFGADGVRVDGAQDFKWWDADARVMRHDDDYLIAMREVPQEAAGVAYRPWFVFEDGRPWPQEDWELSSTYRAVTELLSDPDVFQWGPLTFAHNTPFLYTFWLSKLWRIRQIMDGGESWISGCSNHDTLRRGTQVSPELNVNTRLGSTLMEILDKAYDNPAVQMFTYAACPGVPMDFLNASARASWGFVRNQDDRWGVKVMSEEAISLRWQVDELTYEKPIHFPRLKAMGFATLADLRRAMDLMPGLVAVTGYDLAAMARLLAAVEPPLAGVEPSVAGLKALARAWMDDMHAFTNVAHYTDLLGEAQTGFNHALREFRLARPWLRGNLREGERFGYHRPVDGSVVFRCLRRAPDGGEVLAVTLMEGAPARVDPFATDGGDWPGVDRDGWTLALATPGLDARADAPLDLVDSTGAVFVR